MSPHQQDLLTPTVRFSNVAELYRQFRPTYPSSLLAWITSEIYPNHKQECKVVDVGAGTGIFTRLLLEHGYGNTIGVEPNAAMRKESGLPASIMRDGSAENTGLEDGYADAIFVAQAFHWFDIDKTVMEFKRISRSDDTTCIVFWNDRKLDGKPGTLPYFTAELDRIYRKHSSEYGHMPRPQGTIAKLASRIPLGKQRQFEYVDYLTLQTLLGRAWSTSYIDKGVKDRVAFEQDMTALFHQHCILRENMQVVPVVYVCKVFYWKVGDVSVLHSNNKL